MAIQDNIRKAVGGTAGALGIGAGADAAEGNGLDKARAALGELGGSVSDLVGRVTPDFISDFVSGIVEAARGGGDVAGEAAGMVVPYLLDIVPVVVV